MLSCHFVDSCKISKMHVKQSTHLQGGGGAVNALQGF